MRVVSKALFTFLAFAFCLGVISAAQQAGRIKSMKLLTADVGWAATDKRLFWTADNGAHWKDITPKLNHKRQVVSSVFFRDASTGWALLKCGDDRDILTDEGCWALASTNDAGGSWYLQKESILVPFSKQYLRDSTGFSGRSWLQFVDSQYGFEVLEIATHAGIPQAGQMLRTADGGKTWITTKELPFPDHFRFVTRADGWLAGGDDGELFVTHDAGDSWQKVSFPEPQGLGKHFVGSRGLPIFENERRGSDWVQYVTGPPEGPNPSVLVTFSTADRGKSWVQDAASSELPTINDAEIAGSTVVAVHSELDQVSQGEGQCPSRRISLSLFSVGPGRPTAHASATLPLPDGASEQLSFLDGERGWTVIAGQLFGTPDGGKNWAELTPGGAPHEPPSVCVPVSALGAIIREDLSVSGLSPTQAASGN